MAAIHVPVDKGTVYTPVTKTCRASADRGTIWTPKPWVRINDLSSLHPEGTFRTVAMAAAKQFVADMERQGFSLITAEADMNVYGPLRHRDFSGAGAATWRPMPGMVPTFRSTGFAFMDEDDSEWEDFLLRAEFLSKRIHLVEHIRWEKEPGEDDV